MFRNEVFLYPTSRFENARHRGTAQNGLRATSPGPHSHWDKKETHANNSEWQREFYRTGKMREMDMKCDLQYKRAIV